MSDYLIYREKVGELQTSSNGKGQYEEMGSVGLTQYAGYIQEAYNAKLYWPGVYDLYNRLRRSDPEITIVRYFYSVLAHDTSFVWELPEDATPADEELNEFLDGILHDIVGGQRKFVDTLTSYVPFMGFGWWEAVPGLRKAGWNPPDGDEWESTFDDGRIGIRKLAWRDHSSFEKWKTTDAGDLVGLWQSNPPKERVLIPLDVSLHIVFGDSNNPEGLSPLEAVWRLERIKYGLEIIQGMGFEHAAGHLKVTAVEELDAVAKETIKQAARSIMSAQEGNYFTEIEGKFTGELMDVPFQAAPSLLSAIQYYSILKLQVYNMQWVALSATTGSGSFSAMQDSSTMMLKGWNNMMDGFAEQVGEQLWNQLARYNPEFFAKASAKQKLTATPIEKDADLAALSTLIEKLFPLMPVGEEDWLAVRRKIGFLPEVMPEEEIEPEPEPIPDELVPEEESEEDEMPDEEPGELADRPIGIVESLNEDGTVNVNLTAEIPESSAGEEVVTEEDISGAMSRFKRWARKNAPWAVKLLDADVEIPEE